MFHYTVKTSERVADFASSPIVSIGTNLRLYYPIRIALGQVKIPRMPIKGGILCQPCRRSGRSLPLVIKVIFLLSLLASMRRRHPHPELNPVLFPGDQ